MIQDTKFERGMRAFARDWLYLDTLEGEVNRDPEIYPDFDPESRFSAIEESAQLLLRFARDNQNVFRKIFSTKSTAVDERLADLYGLEQTGQVEFAQNSARGGLLTQASQLMITSGVGAPSIINRGLFVNKRFLCREIPNPDPNLRLEFPGNLPSNAGNRAKVEELEKNPACAGCHVVIDAPGFALENFDSIGAYAEEDPFGNLLVSTGVYGVGGMQVPFASAAEYGKLLADDPAVSACLTENTLRFALGRSLTQADQCTLEQIRADWSNRGGTLSDLLVAIANSATFRQMEAK